MNNFSEPRKQELIGVVVIFLDNVRKIIRAFFALIALAFLQEGIGPYMKFGAIAIVGFVAVTSWLQYQRFRFHIQGGDLILQKGVFVKENLTIPLDRIQTVNLQQNLIQQLLGITGVKIDTAGSGKEELVIKALKKDAAAELQSLLKSGKQAAPSEETTHTHAEEDSPEQSKVLVDLNFSKLLVVGATENHLKSGLIAFALIWGYATQFSDVIGSEYLDSLESEVESNLVRAGWLAVIFLVVAFAIASVLTSFGRVILRHFQLKAILSNEALQVKAGLLKRNEHTIPLNKIQILQWEDNFLRRKIGFESLKIFQGRSEDNPNSKRTIEVPACFEGQYERVMSTLYPSLDEGQMEQFSPDAHHRRILTILFGGIFALFAGLLSTTNVYLALVPMVAFVVAFFWIKKYVESVKISKSEDHVVIEKGLLFRKKIIIENHRIQGVEFEQSIFLKRRGLAHIKIHTAAGTRIVRYLPMQNIFELYDDLLFRIETSTKAWM